MGGQEIPQCVMALALPFEITSDEDPLQTCSGGEKSMDSRLKLREGQWEWSGKDNGSGAGRTEGAEREGRWGVGRNGQGAGPPPARLGAATLNIVAAGKMSLFPPPLRGRARVGGQEIPQCVMALALLFEIISDEEPFADL